jgi:predicted dehydrogenase
MPPRRRLRFGLIGLGKHGSRYARHIREDLPGIELAAVSRQDPERLETAARDLGARPFGSYRELIEEGGVDAVVAVVPPTLHRDIVRVAAAAGVPVLLEKPAAPNLRAGRAILALLRRHPVPVMVAQTLRYNAVVRALLAHRRKLGRLRSLTFTQRFEPSRLAWLDDPERSGGGVGLHTAVHAFDLMRVVTGMEADDVTCQVESVRTKRTEDNFVATVRLGGGAALATVACSRAAGGRNGHVEVAGEKGTVIGDHVLHRAQLIVGTRVEPIPVPAPVPTVREVLRDFARAVRHGSPVAIPFVEGLRAVALAEACIVSARKGRRTAVESVEG